MRGGLSVFELESKKKASFLYIACTVGPVVFRLQKNVTLTKERIYILRFIRDKRFALFLKNRDKHLLSNIKILL